MKDGYATMRTLDIKARADMIESVAGFENDGWRVKSELHFAIHAADEDDADTLRWLACIIERRLIDLEQ